MAELNRELLDELIAAKGTTYGQVSELLGRNMTYIQQFIKRGHPKKLSLDDQQRLIAYFGLPKDFLIADASEVAAGDFLSVTDSIRKAILFCDKVGLATPACHLQLGLDLMEEWQICGRKPGRGSATET